MRTLLLVGSLVAGVLIFAFEWYSNRERAHEEAPYGRGGAGPTFADEDFIHINETSPKKLEKRLGKDRKLPSEGEVCSICLELLINYQERKEYCIIALPGCGHWFHQKCALRLLEYHPHCPVCRIDIDPSALRGTPVRVEREQDTSHVISQ